MLTFLISASSPPCSLPRDPQPRNLQLPRHGTPRLQLFFCRDLLWCWRLCDSSCNAKMDACKPADAALVCTRTQRDHPIPAMLFDDTYFFDGAHFSPRQSPNLMVLFALTSTLQADKPCPPLPLCLFFSLSFSLSLSLRRRAYSCVQLAQLSPVPHSLSPEERPGLEASARRHRSLRVMPRSRPRGTWPLIPLRSCCWILTRCARCESALRSFRRQLAGEVVDRWPLESPAGPGGFFER